MNSRRPNYELVQDHAGDPLLIRDLGPWDEHLTITNDPEHVVTKLRSAGMLPFGRRLFYYDSAGILDELVVKDGKFAGFKTGPRPKVCADSRRTKALKLFGEQRKHGSTVKTAKALNYLYGGYEQIFLFGLSRALAVHEATISAVEAADEMEKEYKTNWSKQNAKKRIRKIPVTDPDKPDGGNHAPK